MLSSYAPPIKCRCAPDCDRLHANECYCSLGLQTDRTSLEVATRIIQEEERLARREEEVLHGAQTILVLFPRCLASCESALNTADDRHAKSCRPKMVAISQPNLGSDLTTCEQTSSGLRTLLWPWIIIWQGSDHGKHEPVNGLDILCQQRPPYDSTWKLFIVKYVAGGTWLCGRSVQSDCRLSAHRCGCV